MLKSQLKDWQGWEDATYNYYQEQFQQREQAYLKWQKEFQDRLNNCCQANLNLEQLLNRYKKGKISWEQRANLLDTELQTATTKLQEQVKLKQENTAQFKKITSLEDQILQLRLEKIKDFGDYYQAKQGLKKINQEKLDLERNLRETRNENISLETKLFSNKFLPPSFKSMSIFLFFFFLVCFYLLKNSKKKYKTIYYDKK